MIIAKITSIRTTTAVFGFCLFGNALSMQTIESMDKSMDMNAQIPIPILFIVAVVFDIFVRLNERIANDTKTIAKGINWGLRFKVTMNFRAASLTDAHIFVKMFFFSILPFLKGVSREYYPAPRFSI
jgi:hypothetical protein